MRQYNKHHYTRTLYRVDITCYLYKIHEPAINNMQNMNKPLVFLKTLDGRSRIHRVWGNSQISPYL